MIRTYYAHLFPGLVGYHRFLALRTCHNRRIHSQKIFEGLAKRGKTTMGWFYGFKIHLIVNGKGDLLSFYLSKGNTYDRDPTVIREMIQSLFGKLFWDKDYISKVLFESSFADGIQLTTRLCKDMKGHNQELKYQDPTIQTLPDRNDY